jgi:uncharacterized protein (TIGR03067 family)
MLLGLIMVGVVAPASSSVRADDAADLIGVWVPIGLESGGTVFTPEQVKSIAAQATFTITKEKITRGAAGEIQYTLIPETSPKGIDTVDLNGSTKGELRKGIYDLRDDTLRLAIGAKDAPRPQRFSTKPGEEGIGERVITFQRRR